MEQVPHYAGDYGYPDPGQVWRRVAPEMEPYPMRQQTGPMPPTELTPQAPGAMARGEGNLPGAAPDPCCMGSAAADMLQVLAGFIEEELEDRRAFQALTRRAPGYARQPLRDMAAEEGEHARRLMAVYYLVTGQCYRPAVCPPQPVCGSVRQEPWCAALRTRYHEEACNGLNYIRASEGTTDPCLAKLLEELSKAEYRHAETLLGLLEQGLR